MDKSENNNESFLDSLSRADCYQNFKDIEMISFNDRFRKKKKGKIKWQINIK